MLKYVQNNKFEWQLYAVKQIMKMKTLYEIVYSPIKCAWSIKLQARSIFFFIKNKTERKGCQIYWPIFMWKIEREISVKKGRNNIILFLY